MKKVKTALLSIAMVLSICSTAFAGQIYERMKPVNINKYPQGPTILVDDKNISATDSLAVYKNGSVYVPLTFFMNLGLVAIDKNALDEKYETYDNSVSVIFSGDKAFTTVKFNSQGENKPFFISETGHTYVNLRQVSDFFGFTVQYNLATDTIKINKLTNQE